MGIHLVILVHGLWGTVAHFDYVCSQLESYNALIHDSGGEIDHDLLKSNKQNNRNQVVVYRTTTNQGYFTYDGIDVCGTRVANEISSEVDYLNEIVPEAVKEISIVGYSLGGLVIRYAAGVLYRRKFFDKIKPATFTTICTPHVGVVVLGDRFGARAFNSVGAISMASTSKQLFLRDRYFKEGNNSGEPLLLYMSDPKGPFYQALASFERLSLYANIVNDHRCEWYTTAISSVDPFQRGRGKLVRGPYSEGYTPTVLTMGEGEDFLFSDDSNLQDTGLNSSPSSASSSTAAFFSKIGRYLIAFLKILFIIPLWFIAFSCNATYQNIVSSVRQRAFKRQGWMDDVDMGPSMTERLEEEADDVVESMYRAVTHSDRQQNADEFSDSASEISSITYEDTPKLQLDTTKLTIIDRLNTLNWNKNPVHITQHHHAHAAVIVRYRSSGFKEGFVVVKHLVEKSLGLH